MVAALGEGSGAAGEQVVGAAMVVGGGIAGMQAAIDLADQGFKVYLVEAQSAIGGKMAQLDKTFPTNDCAMCTISPRLVETGRHPNIEILTETEVLDVGGKAGHFNVRLRHKPRYIDTDKCVACGDCATACPVLVPDTFNNGLILRHAAYKLYPQAVPNAYAIEKRGIAPCRDACPAGQRAQGYIALIHEGRWQDALEVIKMDNPFPGICGRICNHRCETACNRGLVDEAINIRALKRFVTDKVYAGPRPAIEPVPRTRAESVAIIGAGPCGLTAAQDLVQAGYEVTVFEAMPVAGGMLRLGVPEYRLPTAIIEREVQDIIDLGVDLRLNHRIDDLDELFDQGFDAVLIAVGAHEGIRLPIPGSRLDGVLINTHFLRDVRLGKYQPSGNAAAQLGKRVLVLGGGNVAIDCARTAIRLGKEVHLACLESRDEMPAHAWEVDEAQSEGVQIHTGLSFEEILGDTGGQVRGVECMQVASFSFDDSGRLHLEKVPGSQHVIPCDSVIFSVGQRAGLAFIPDDAGVGLTNQRTIAVNPNTFATSRPGVFAAGDSVSGTAFVIEAVANGHKAAQSISRFLQGLPLEPPPKPELPVVRFTQEEISQKLEQGEIHHQRRVPMPAISLQERRHSFAEVECGYDEESARAEAERCLACGICSECMRCTLACGVDAIDHNMVAREDDYKVGAIVLAPGYRTFQAALAAEYGLGRYPNVVTALQFERLLSASGPTLGHIQRISDSQRPQRIAFLQCIGSRDQEHDYCSAVCCMYATKEAVIAKEHDPGLDIHIFFMDMRVFSKGYWAYYQRARERYAVQYHRCRVSALFEDPETRDLLLTYQDEPGNIHHERFDMVVLSVGMEIADSTRQLARRMGISLDTHGFCRTGVTNPLETTRPGIYAVGPFREPKDIPESVVEACGAAAAVGARLSSARHTLTVTPSYPPERNVIDEPARVGVFVCHCGSNIAGYLDVNEVTEYAASLPDVAHAESNLYTCSQDSIRHISTVVQEQGLNRVVVASCTPLTHAPLFKDSLRAAQLNPFLFEMANIRNQCSWVHSHDREAATAKAKDLVHMAVARVVHNQPLATFSVPVEQSALVVGGGVAGMTAALSLADNGYPVALVERTAHLGGNMRRLYSNIPSHRDDEVSPRKLLFWLIRRVNENAKITLFMESEVIGTQGFKGKFSSTIRHKSGETKLIKHGVTILATGGREYHGDEYAYKQDSRIITQLEFESILAGRSAVPGGIVSFTDNGNQAQDDQLKHVAMILCIGPAEKYCSRICCTVAIKNALRLKQAHPGIKVTIFYQDIRTYGFKENLYTTAREHGVVFIRYTPERKPQVRVDPVSASLVVTAWETTLKCELRIQPDLVVLSEPVVPQTDAPDIAAMFKIPLDNDGFFQEAHIKLRPVDFPTDGIFMAGMAHYPKLIDEAMIQAKAAASRAARVLSHAAMPAGGQVALVEAEKCTGCLTCVRICPFNVPQIRADLLGAGGIQGAAFIEASVCQGCGQCVAECPARAISLCNYTDVQLASKVDALISLNDIRLPVA